MAFKVVLDANVLYPFSLRDTLLRLAEHELYVLAWSERILDEVSRNLVDDGRTDMATAVRLQAAMRSAFPEALIDADAIAAIEPAMANDPGDRHVLATAVVAGAIAEQAADLRRPPLTPAQLLDLLQLGRVGRFTARMREMLELPQRMDAEILAEREGTRSSDR